MGQKPRHESVRIGFKQDFAGYRHPPVKVSVTSSAHAAEVLQSAKRLKCSLTYLFAQIGRWKNARVDEKLLPC